jgi:imidazolonepropionase-like amidohydrolase
VNRLAIFVLLLLQAAIATSAPMREADLFVRHATIVDVEHARAISGRAVAIRGGDIVAVGPDAALALEWTSAHEVDAHGRFVIPGLWDMHMHLGGGPDLVEENAALLPLYIANGITTVRDCSGDLADQVLAWRDEIASGKLLGPTLYTSGAKLEGIKPVWKGTLEVGSKADVDKALAHEQAVRVDFVKITDNTLDPQLFLYAVARAKALGFRTSAHIPMADTVEQAADAGLSSIEHLDYAFKAGAKDEAAISAEFGAGKIDRAEANRRIDSDFDRFTAMKAYRRFAAQGIYVTPTLNISRILAYLDRDKHDADAALAYIGPGLIKTYDWRIERAAKATPAEVAARHAHYEKMAAILPLLQKAGVPIMAGTDAGFLNTYDYPGFGLHDELTLFVQNGLTPAQALASATRNGAAWFGKLDRYGAIAPNKAADLVILTRNPLEDIAATRAIDAVILRGRLFDRAALDGLLADTRAKVAAWKAAGNHAETPARK